LLRGLAAAGLGWGAGRHSHGAAAKRQRTRQQNGKQGLCRKNGSPCRRPRRTCKKKYCLRAPFTVEAKWTQPANHDTYLFVPPENATTGPHPYIYTSCTPANSVCNQAYPFACVDTDETQTGAEVTTVYDLLSGDFEYWLGLATTAPAGAVTVALKAANGRTLRQWASPANPSTEVQAAWHVFDLDGRDGRVTSIDELVGDRTPSQIYAPDTNVCPRNP
jgi:hypothetical protein